MLISGLLFYLGSAGYIAAKADLRTYAQNLVDQSDEKIEDSNPYCMKCQLWIHICFIAVIISMLLLFVCVAL